MWTVIEIAVTPLFNKETFLQFCMVVAKRYSFALVKILYKVKTSAGSDVIRTSNCIYKIN